MSEETRDKIEDALRGALERCGTEKIQMFDSIGLVGDHKELLFKEDGIVLLFAPGYLYVELLGLSEEGYNYFFEKYGCE